MRHKNDCTWCGVATLETTDILVPFSTGKLGFYSFDTIPFHFTCRTQYYINRHTQYIRMEEPKDRSLIQ